MFIIKRVEYERQSTGFEISFAEFSIKSAALEALEGLEASRESAYFADFEMSALTAGSSARSLALISLFKSDSGFEGIEVDGFYGIWSAMGINFSHLRNKYVSKLLKRN